MSKLLVETTGSFMLLVPNGGQVIDETRPTVVARDSFVQRQIAQSRLQIVCELPAEADDQDLLKLWNEDAETAVEVFRARFTKDPEPKPNPKPSVDKK